MDSSRLLHNSKHPILACTLRVISDLKYVNRGGGQVEIECQEVEEVQDGLGCREGVGAADVGGIGRGGLAWDGMSIEQWHDPLNLQIVDIQMYQCPLLVRVVDHFEGAHALDCLAHITKV